MLGRHAVMGGVLASLPGLLVDTRLMTAVIELRVERRDDGWVLAGAGAVIIFVGILANLEIYFRQTSLYNLILMLVLFAGGLGMMARAVRAS